MIEPWMVLVTLVTGVIGLLIGKRKGHPVFGFFCGFLLSVLGIIIVACTRTDEQALIRKRAAELRIEEAARRQAGLASGPQVLGPVPPQDAAPPPRGGVLGAYREAFRNDGDSIP